MAGPRFLPALAARAATLAGLRTARAADRLAEALGRAGVRAVRTSAGVRISGRGLRRRLLTDPALRILGRLIR